jgi:hypothetical protein
VTLLTNIKGRNLTDVMKEICESYGDDYFTSEDIYKDILNMPKRNGRKRHYALTYSEVKQRLARARYVEKVEDDAYPVARYRNRRLRTN